MNDIAPRRRLRIPYFPRLLHVFPAAVALLGTISLCACVDQKKEVSLYRQVIDGPHPATQPLYDSTAPLPLKDALRRANADDESIDVAGETYIQALAAKMRDAGTFLPTLSLGPSYSLTNTKSTFIAGTSSSTSSTTSGSGTTTGSGSTTSSQTTGTTIAGRTSHQTSIPFAASMTGSLSNISAYESAGQTAAQDKQLILDEQETILQDVAQSYYAALTAERQADVFVRSLDSKEEEVRDQQARYKLGESRQLDLFTSESDLAATRVSLTQARATAANSRSALARLMGVPSVDGPLTDNFAPPEDEGNLDHWHALAMENRQDLQAAALAVEAARLGVEAAIREYFPTVSIDFNYFLYNDPKSTTNWTLGLSANVPIFSALAIEADVRNAWSVYRQNGLNESLVRRQAMDDVNQDYENWISAREEVAQLQVEVKAAQSAFDLAQREYQLGAESNLDRLTQQDSLLSAQLNLVTEQLTEKSSYLSLLRASGILRGALD